MINQIDYEHDLVGNRIGATYAPSGEATTWTYDRGYQLTREERSGTPSFDVTYTYDPVGNRLTQQEAGQVTTYSYDAANQLLSQQSSAGVTTYSYDEDGNRTKKETPAAVIDYTWDEDSRLINAEPVTGMLTLAYNAEGRRVRKETPSDVKKFIYDQKKLLQTTDGENDPQRDYTSTVDEYGDLLSEYDGTDTTYHLHDGQYSMEALLDENEAETDRFRHRAFGIEQSHTGTTDTSFTFGGQQGYYSDPELDLYLLSARYYDPAAGRFISQDPMGFEAGDENLYRYAHNNPANAVDPSGTDRVFVHERYAEQSIADSLLRRPRRQLDENDVVWASEKDSFRIGTALLQPTLGSPQSYRIVLDGQFGGMETNFVIASKAAQWVERTYGSLSNVHPDERSKVIQEAFKIAQPKKETKPTQQEATTAYIEWRKTLRSPWVPISPLATTYVEKKSTNRPLDKRRELVLALHRIFADEVIQRGIGEDEIESAAGEFAFGVHKLFENQIIVVPSALAATAKAQLRRLSNARSNAGQPSIQSDSGRSQWEVEYSRRQYRAKEMDWAFLPENEHDPRAIKLRGEWYAIAGVISPWRRPVMRDVHEVMSFFELTPAGLLATSMQMAIYGIEGEWEQVGIRAAGLALGYVGGKLLSGGAKRSASPSLAPNGRRPISPGTSSEPIIKPGPNSPVPGPSGVRTAPDAARIGVRNFRGELVQIPEGHVMSPRDPAMSAPPIVQRGPFTTAQRDAFLAGNSGGTRLAPHHRHQIPTTHGGVIDELPGPGHPAGNVHTAGSPSRHPSPSIFKSLEGGEALRASEIQAHWQAKGQRLVEVETGVWIDSGF
jgi:RHS repeat-associated protein